MRFETEDQAFDALANEDTHQEAARDLLAHADLFDAQSNWKWARPMMFAIAAHYRDTLDYGTTSTGPAVYEALRRLENYLRRQMWDAIAWNPDIDADAAFAARADYEFGD